jgi:hypothetical protein
VDTGLDFSAPVLQIEKELPMAMRNRRTAGFIWWKLLVLLMLVTLLVGFAIWRALCVAGSMSVVAARAEDLEQAKPEEKTKIVIEVDTADKQGSIRGRLLEKKTEEIYTRTNMTVVVAMNSDTKILMGKREDVQKSAVIHVTGTQKSRSATGATAIEAQQVVILTAYVKVE